MIHICDIYLYTRIDMTKEITEKIFKSGNNGCNRTLSVNKFHKSASHSCGYHPLCKDCRSQSNKTKANNRPEDGTNVYCSECQTNKKAKDFASCKANKNGLQNKCKICKNKTTKDYKQTFDGYLNFTYGDLVCNNKRRTKPFEVSITKDDIKTMYQKQKEKCNLTSASLNTDNGYNFSVDRIDSTKGYVNGNVHLTSGCVNKSKIDLDMKDIIKKCQMIKKHFKKYKNKD
jgi:hypothetical protein